MAHDILIAPAPVVHEVEAPLEQAAHLPPLPAPSPEQIQATDALFAQDHDSESTARLMGMWFGTMLLHDLAREHFNSPADEAEREDRNEVKQD